MAEEDADWLGDLRWQGYPKRPPAPEAPAPAPRPAAAPEPAASASSRAPAPFNSGLAAENAALRARVDQLARLSGDFERLLADAKAALDDAERDAQGRLAQAAREEARQRERLLGELAAAKGELERVAGRDAARAAELKRERELRAAAERALLEARRALAELQTLRSGLRGLLERRRAPSPPSAPR